LGSAGDGPADVRGGNGGYIVYSRYDARLTVLALGDLALAWALQL
jgi:hypothetical protein